MTIWVDAQLSPAIAVWIKDNLDVEAFALRDIGLRDEEDEEIFQKAKEANAIVITKDSDFVSFHDRFRFATQNHLANLRQYFQC